MKIASMIAAASVCWASLVAASEPVIDAVEKLRARLDKGDIRVLDSIREMPTDEAIALIRMLRSHYLPKKQTGNEVIYSRCAEIRKSLPGVEAWYEAELALQSKRGPWDLEMASTAAGELASLQNRRALEILAQYLKVPKPVYHRGPGDDTPAPTWLAQEVVRDMYQSLGVANLPPLKSGSASSLSDDEVTRVAEWWEENKHQPDFFFFPSMDRAGGVAERYLRWIKDKGNEQSLA